LLGDCARRSAFGPACLHSKQGWQVVSARYGMAAWRKSARKRFGLPSPFLA